MIYVDQQAGMTVCSCDRCGVIHATEVTTGVVPDGWLTGQFLLDVSLSEQRQTPICFCLECREAILGATALQISASSALT